MTNTPDTFPRQYARTRRFTLGLPRDLVIDDERGRVLYLCSASGSDPVHHLFAADLTTGTATRMVDGSRLDAEELPDAERARRERLRESADGITAFSVDRSNERAVFTVGGRLYMSELTTTPATTRHIPVDGAVFDPRLSPDGTLVAFVTGTRLAVCDLDGEIIVEFGDDNPLISWGSADFVAAEEMRRLRGFWWSPDSRRIVVCRTDETPVATWYVSDPAHPTTPPRPHRYPAAGTDNPAVELHIAALDGSTTPVSWDRHRYEYLPSVSWTRHGLLITVQTRDQRSIAALEVDPVTGATATRWSDHDDAWVELVPSSPQLVAAGLISVADRDGSRRILLDDQPITPIDQQVRGLCALNDQHIVFTANPVDNPTVLGVYRYEFATAAIHTHYEGDGVATAAAGTSTVAVRSSNIDEMPTWHLPNGVALPSHAETPLVSPRPTFVIGERFSTAVLLPEHHDGSPLPVLLDPYAGPSAQRVLRSRAAMASSQWFADQGFAVVVTDGRGTPGRGSAFEHAVLDDLAVGVLDDQIEALDRVAATNPILDLDRVAIRGWSFGGYLAALAVLKRPDRIHAAVAGAPVTDWRLYDTHYTERYLGHPDEQPDVYYRNSLLPLATDLQRPLLMIHGLADDNVVAAHTLQLSAALLAAGRQHAVLPLVGVTHMTPQEVIAENLLLHQLRFLREALGLATVGSDG